MLPESALTPREKEILPLLLFGATREEIAKDLGISAETVKLHTRNLFAKFSVANLRDGFVALSNFQKYYGNGGMGLDRFTKSIVVETELLPGRMDQKITRTETFVSMIDSLAGFPRRFFEPNGNLVELEYESNSMRVEYTGNERGKETYFIHINPPIHSGEEFTYIEHILVKGHKSLDADSEGVTWSIPFMKRTMRYLFPQDDPPIEIWYETHLNITKVQLSGTKERRLPHMLELEISDFMPATTLRVHWRYE